MSNTPKYDVVSPIGQPVMAQAASGTGGKSIEPAAPLAELAGKKIGFIWTKFRNGDLLLAAFAKLLGERFAGMEFIQLPSGEKLPWGDYPDQTFGNVIRSHKVDGLIAAPAC